MLGQFSVGRDLSLHSKVILQDQNMQQLFTNLGDGDTAV